MIVNAQLFGGYYPKGGVTSSKIDEIISYLGKCYFCNKHVRESIQVMYLAKIFQKMQSLIASTSD